jgi:hypothetical protein
MILFCPGNHIPVCIQSYFIREGLFIGQKVGAPFKKELVGNPIKY